MLLSGLGYLFDRLAGLVPVLTIVFFLVGVVGVGVKEYYVYEAAMQAHEAKAPWRTPPPGASGDSDRRR
jgi:F0F1-type ATP synthase assembly protein I